MKKWIIGFMLLCLLTPMVYGSDMIEIDTDALTQELDGQTTQLLPEFSRNQSPDLWKSLQDLFFGGIEKASDSFHEALRLCALLLAVLTLCSIAQMSISYTTAVNIVGALAITVTILGSFQSMLTLSENTMEKMADYSAFLLPILASSTMLSGGSVSSSALYSGTLIFSNLLMQLISKVLMPAVYFYIAIATAEAAIDNDMLTEIREFIGWLISKSLRIVMYIFIGYMSITGVISGSSDAAALKATKAAISGMIPVVGSIASDASESLLASASILKNSVGIFGMLAVLAICIVPFLRVGLHYLLMKLTAAVSSTVGLKPHVKLLKHFSQAMGFVLGMCGACALLLLISCVCFLKVVI